MPSLQATRTGDQSDPTPDPNFQGWLGSSKTVITYIQPTKMGEERVAIPAALTTSEMDEFGIRVRTRTISGGLAQERGEEGLPAAATGKPLSHVRQF